MGAHIDTTDWPATTLIELVSPDDTSAEVWDGDPPTDGRHALILGDPYGNGAQAVVASRDDLDDLAARIQATVTTATAVDRELTLWVPTERLWLHLHAAIGQPPYALGRYKEWAALAPKTVPSHYDIDAAIGFARHCGLPYEITSTHRYPGTIGTVGTDDRLHLS